MKANIRKNMLPIALAGAAMLAAGLAWGGSERARLLYDDVFNTYSPLPGSSPDDCGGGGGGGGGHDDGHGGGGGGGCGGSESGGHGGHSGHSSGHSDDGDDD